MSAVLTRNQTPEAAVAPPKDDGGHYRYEMVFEGGRTRAYADTATDLLDVLIFGGYAGLDEQARLTARVRYATGLLAPLQANLLQQVDQAALTETERAFLLAPRTGPVEVDTWDSEVPLVLLDVHYAPYSALPAPLSTVEPGVGDPRNLVWLRVVEETDFLVSLAKVGMIGLAESADFQV